MDWLRSLVQNELWARVIIGALIAGAFHVLSRFVKMVLHILGKKIFAKTETVLDDKILEVVLAHVKPLMILTGLHIGLREVRKGALASDLTVNQILDYGESILYIVVVVIVVKILLNIFRVIIDWYLDNLSSEGTSDLKLSLGPLTSKVANILVGMVAVIVILDHFGINIGSLLVSLGVGSLAVAMAAQETIANMIAGFVILADKPFRVGDRIELATREIGDVQSIGLRSTKILNFDNNVVIVPNGELVKTRIINYSYPARQIKVQLSFNVAYGTDPGKVRQILIDVARRNADVLAEPAPEVFLTTLKDSAVEFTLVARSADYLRRWAAETAIREEAYNAFKSAGIEIPLPQQVVHTKAAG
jgi:small-conductance mechanosensitive channel